RTPSESRRSLRTVATARSISAGPSGSRGCRVAGETEALEGPPGASGGRPRPSGAGGRDSAGAPGAETSNAAGRGPGRGTLRRRCDTSTMAVLHDGGEIGRTHPARHRIVGDGEGMHAPLVPTRSPGARRVASVRA